MTAATKPKPKKKTTLGFKQLLARTLKHESAAGLVKLAVTSGWLTDEATFLTRLSEEEQAKVREVYNASGYKRTNVATVTLPEQVGPLADEQISRGKVTLVSGERSVEVDGQLYLSLKRRHPAAIVYLSPNEDGPIIFSERSTVALLYQTK